MLIVKLCYFRQIYLLFRDVLLFVDHASFHVALLHAALNDAASSLFRQNLNSIFERRSLSCKLSGFFGGVLTVFI